MIPARLQRALELDAGDELASFRDRFVNRTDGEIYLDGNSLGRLPKQTEQLAAELVGQQWGQRLIRGWNDGWLELTARIGGKIAKLVGADPDEVVIADSTSVNLFKLAVAALRARPSRSRIVTDDLNFPSDVHVLQSALFGASSPDCSFAVRPRVEIVRSNDGIAITDDQLAAAIDRHVGLVSLSHTAFKSGFTYDLACITELAHREGALIIWDLSHSVGVIPIDLHAAGVDFAVGCTYKYLCGGPGAPAFLFIRRDLHDQLANPIQGWFGSRDPFEFALGHHAAHGIARFLTGTPPVISLALIEPGVDLVTDARIDRLRAKSVRQSEFFIECWAGELVSLGYSLNSPRQSACRGSHVSLGHPDAWRITQSLVTFRQVIPDFRRPNNIRIGICPLYTSFLDLRLAVDALRDIVVNRQFEDQSTAARGVT